MQALNILQIRALRYKYTKVTALSTCPVGFPRVADCFLASSLSFLPGTKYSIIFALILGPFLALAILSYGINRSSGLHAWLLHDEIAATRMVSS